MATPTSGARRVFTSSLSSPGLFWSIRSSKASANLKRLSRPKFPSNVSRIPVELGCVQSLMPLHSVTASALLNLMLSLKSGSWGWFSEGISSSPPLAVVLMGVLRLSYTFKLFRLLV